ncbi:hypothetical protein BGZ94_000600, partial [Podila epigama]
MLLVDDNTIDSNGDDTQDKDTDMDHEMSPWMYYGFDLQELVANIHVDFIRITSDRTLTRKDDLNKMITRTCTASVYTVRSTDDTSIATALTNLYLQQNKDIQVMRVKGIPLPTFGGGSEAIELFIRTNHPRIKRISDQAKTMNYGILEKATQVSEDASFFEYESQCGHVLHGLPTKSVHLAALSPSTFAASFYSFVGKEQGSVSLTATTTRALVDHDNQLFVHCYKSDKESLEILEDVVNAGDTVPKTPKRFLGPTESDRVEDFLSTIVRPNTIVHGLQSFTQDGNKFIEIHPTGSVRSGYDNGNDKDMGAEGISTTPLTKLALIHSTVKMDIETRWLCQWDDERMPKLTRGHEVEVQLFRNAICKAQLDSAGMTAITQVLDNLIADARPMFLPGEQPNKSFAPQQQQWAQIARESARAVLANLWLIGQRFKSISPSHQEVAKLIATKITPKGLDHQTVKLTLLPPNVRRRMAENMMNAGQGDSGSNSPNVDGDMGDVWNKNRGGVNLNRGG